MQEIDPKLRRAFSPGCVAIVGASEDRNKVGGRPLHYLKAMGFQGAVYPINPRRSLVQGRPAFPSLAAVPATPDVAVVAVPDHQVLDAVAQCGQRGVGAAVVMSSGFGESGADGIQRQDALLRCAREHGVRLIGPNAQGVANFQTGAVLNFSTMFMETRAKDGPVAIISQSGAASVMPYAMLRERGIGVRYVVASGNDADASVAELALVAAADPDIRVLLLYIESLADTASLAELARRANARGAAVVVLKAGRSEEGARAAASHTGAIVNDDVSVDAFLERHGIWRAPDVHGLVNAVALQLASGGPDARRLAVLSNSGAVGVLAADGAARFCIPLAQLSADTVGRLTEVMPGFAAARNPIDLTAALMSDGSMFSRTLDAVAADPEADMLLVGVPVAGEGYDVHGMAADLAAMAARAGKPAVVFSPQPAVRDVFRDKGVPVFDHETDALAALSQVVQHARMRREALRRDRLATGDAAGSAPGLDVELPEAPGTLNEADSLRLLGAAGIPVAPHRLCGDAHEAVRAWEELGPEVVVKACSAGIPHKSEHGLVFLGCRTAADIVSAWYACARKVAELGAVLDGIIVARRVRGLREFALGVRNDPLFGTLVMVGDGGKYVEALKDFAVLAWPFEESHVLDKLGRLRIAPLFAGVRGEPPVELDAIARATVLLGRYVAGRSAAIRSVDVNPMIAAASGVGAWAVDGVVETIARQD